VYSYFFPGQNLMLLTITAGLLLLAVTLWYATTKHQRLLAKKLQKPWRIVAVLLGITAVVSAAQQLSWPATMFFCALVFMLAVMLAPLTTLLKKGQSHGH
jgi:uncharacterized MAPEG superfamily protein